MLVAIMFCGSNAQARANKFFEACQEELEPAISAQDKELVAFYPKYLEILYSVMITIYNE